LVDRGGQEIGVVAVDKVLAMMPSTVRYVERYWSDLFGVAPGGLFCGVSVGEHKGLGNYAGVIVVAIISWITRTTFRKLAPPQRTWRCWNLSVLR